MTIEAKLTGFRIENIQPPRICTDPEQSIMCFQEGKGIIIAQTLGIIQLMAVVCKCIAVISAQAIGGGKPYETGPGLVIPITR